MSQTARLESILYSVVAVLVSAAICWLAYRQANPNLAILTVLSPTVLALLFCVGFGGRRSLKVLFIDQTFCRFGWRWFWLSVLTIPCLVWSALLIRESFELDALALRTTQLMPQVIVILVIALGEEYGWRGYLLPRLLNWMTPIKASLFIGLVWAVWHFPAYMIGTGVPDGMNFFVFAGWVVLASVVMTWLFVHTRSVLTAILFHASANMTFNYWWLLPEFTGSQMTFNVLLVLLLCVVGVIVFGDRVMQRQSIGTALRDDTSYNTTSTAP